MPFFTIILDSKLTVLRHLFSGGGNLVRRPVGDLYQTMLALAKKGIDFALIIQY